MIIRDPDTARHLLNLHADCAVDQALISALRERAALIFDAFILDDGPPGEWAAAASRFRTEAEAFHKALGDIRAVIARTKLPVQSDGKEQP